QGMQFFGPPSRINFLGGMAVLISSMIGPGLVTIPSVFQTAGFVTSLTMFIVAVFLSASSALLLCESISSIPGNEGFSNKIEYTKLSQALIPNKFVQALVHFFLYVSLESIIIASIVLSSQSLDSLFVILFGTSCGLGVSPDFGWICTQSLGSGSGPFGDKWMIITLGLAATLLIVIPMAWMNLSNNAKIQIEDQSQVVGAVLFNYGFVTSVPSVVSELKKDVSIKRLVWSAVLITTTFYLLLGIFGAASYKIETSTNIIAIIRKVELENSVAEVATYLFPFLLLFSIPVYAIVLRYNLMRSGLSKSENKAILFVLFPWILVIPLQTGYWLNVFTNWTALIFIGGSNFIIPFLLYILSQRQDAYPPELPISPLTKVFSIGDEEDEFAEAKPFRAFSCCEKRQTRKEKHGSESKGKVDDGEEYGWSWGLVTAWTASMVSLLMIGAIIVYNLLSLLKLESL
ncbi:89_t:CDS:2, partial [Acaulospora morrowiae]